MLTSNHSNQARFRLFPVLIMLIINGALAADVSAEIWTDYSFVQNAVCLQPDGDSIWIGSTTGVWQVRRTDGTFVQYTTAHGLASPLVMDIALDAMGRKWFATMGGVSRFDGAAWLTFTTDDGLIGDQVQAVAVDPASGAVWFGTTEGACRYADGEWTGYTRQDGLVDNRINSVAVDAAGSVWFGTDNGVSRFNGKKWTTYSAAAGLVHNTVNVVVIDGRGGKWFGTDDGVSYYSGSTWTNYRAVDGLSANLVNDLAIDASGTVWFGCYGGGVSEFDGREWWRYTRADGLISNQVTAVATDEDGHVWVGTAGGVSELDSRSSLPETGGSADGAPLEGDLNQDGVSDDSQENVGSLRLPNGEYVTVASEEGTRIADLSMKELPESTPLPSDLDFPYGLIDFTIEDVGVGRSTVVTLYFPEDASPSTYYKYGPTPDQPQDHWYEFMFNGETGAKIDDNVVTLYFVDGKRGDDVYTLDGRIVDIGGPGFSTGQAAGAPAVSGGGASGGGSGGGCFISRLLD